MVSVPRLWPNSTVVILAGGPSLNAQDIETVRTHHQSLASCGRPYVIAIKDAITLAPWADVLYGCDAKWWRHYGDRVAFVGPKYSLEAGSAPWATVLRNTGQTGLETDPSGLRTGKNSGYQSIGLARHLGAKTILLLGYDMQMVNGQNYWRTEPRPRSYSWVQPPYKDFLYCFESIVEPLRNEAIDVINCTPGSALTCFPMMSLADALAQKVAA